MNVAAGQRHAIDVIDKLGGIVGYDYDFDASGARIADPKPAAPSWLRKAVGDDFFRQVIHVDVSQGAASCQRGDFSFCGPTSVTPITDDDLREIARLGHLESLWLDHLSVRERGLRRLPGLRQWNSLAIWEITRKSYRDENSENSFFEFYDIGIWHPRSQITDAGLECLKRLSRLQVLSLNGVHITDAGMEHLGELRQLRYLSVFAPAVTDAGLKHLERLEELEGLFLPAADVTDSGLECLKGLRKLRELLVHGPGITGAGFKHLKALSQLEVVDADWTHFDDEGLQHLKDLSGLRELSLSHTRITGHGLVHLKTLAQLETLNLDDTKVDDDCLRHVEGLRRLRSLSLSGTRVTDAGLAQLSP